MTEIEVHCEDSNDGWRCRVRVSDEAGTSTYDVTIGEPGSVLPSALPDPDVGDIDRLVRETFVFLLEREPRTSILRAFDLSDVSRYFPEYRDTIRARMAR